ncbi:tRNA (adenosine(37)-N6)-threonylcarbamoyltransferase complex ATPase subunit type 1 TsaE [Salicola sp. Rm-C-2C1-2]|uniref:tRNA (adenosine(37)-N6)-threonylcarbamoyltransferase complex ATPase subunit type 1 TsaE n=1 Tax=Salicola sp. Rm-C-2C1-2 TaxID=3141321 RepID=UPI0032E4DE7E
MDESLALELPDEQATEALGAALANALAAGGLVYLAGDLGVGKTTLARGLMHALGHEGAVRSPTFTLVEPYETLSPKVYHFDLYRLGDSEELEMMGIRDYMEEGALVLIEWPERAGGMLPAPECRVEIADGGSGRTARVDTNDQIARVLSQILVNGSSG